MKKLKISHLFRPLKMNRCKETINAMNSPSRKKTCERIAKQRIVFNADEFKVKEIKFDIQTSAKVPSPAGTTK